MLKAAMDPEPQRLARAMFRQVTDRANGKGDKSHPGSRRRQPRKPSTMAAASLTQPDIAPCALIMSIADFWNSGKYEPTQSAGNAFVTTVIGFANGCEHAGLGAHAADNERPD